MGPAGHSEAEAAVHAAAPVGDEFAALRTECAVYPLSRTKIALRGSDRVRWLNGMVTNNVRDLAVGHGVYAFLLNPQGHILGDLYAYNRGDSVLVDTDQAQSGRILSSFDKYIIMDDVEVETLPDLDAIGVAGPKARGVLQAAGIPPAECEPLEFMETGWQDLALTLVRGDSPCVDSYEVWLPQAKVPVLEAALVRAGARPVSPATLELVRIASGIPRYGQDIRERDLPQETEQARALNFSKGCYIGQEIVERIRSRGAVHRKFTGFEVPGEQPEAGGKITADGKEVGEITSAAAVPLGLSTRRIALGYIRREAATPGKKVQIGSSEATVVDLPFQEIFQH
ncbi:MAG TPA: glycine cleavage T C-terminal barrel domain-containing protein [Terriglobales bacterium]|nr:glycine cleavage T C-terminal barrel domain-containing protein [Terriglobales bacterium]